MTRRLSDSLIYIHNREAMSVYYHIYNILSVTGQWKRSLVQPNLYPLTAASVHVVIFSYFNLSKTTTSTQRQRLLKRARTTNKKVSTTAR